MHCHQTTLANMRWNNVVPNIYSDSIHLASNLDQFFILILLKCNNYYYLAKVLLLESADFSYQTVQFHMKLF